jgi:hypothetical protein
MQPRITNGLSALISFVLLLHGPADEKPSPSVFFAMAAGLIWLSLPALIIGRFRGQPSGFHNRLRSLVLGLRRSRLYYSLRMFVLVLRRPCLNDPVRLLTLGWLRSSFDHCGRFVSRWRRRPLNNSTGFVFGRLNGPLDPHGGPGGRRNFNVLGLRQQLLFGLFRFTGNPIRRNCRHAYERCCSSSEQLFPWILDHRAPPVSIRPLLSSGFSPYKKTI